MLRGGFSIALLLCGIGGTLFFRGADADTPQVTAQSSGALEEIIVTAQKRTENLQQTPISITAITGDTLLQQGVTNLESVMEQTPGVAFRSFGPGQTEIEMRGLESEGGTSPTVGFYLDETALTGPTGSQNGKVVIDPNLFDLQRVEILRGPQGTLYGAGSMGGTVRLITNPPDLTGFSAKTQASVSKTEGGGWNHAENAALNVALVPDILAIRLVVSNDYDDGWISRIVANPFPLETNPNPACGAFYGCTRGNVLGAHVTAVHPRANDLDRTSARLAILYKPVDGLSIDLTLLEQKLAAGGYSLFDTNPGTYAHYQPVDFPERIDDEFSLLSLVIKYQLQDFEITSASARWYCRISSVGDHPVSSVEDHLIS
jgi:outer membrane receptor protein involved in Fe transport